MYLKPSARVEALMNHMLTQEDDAFLDLLEVLESSGNRQVVQVKSD